MEVSLGSKLAIVGTRGCDDFIKQVAEQFCEIKLKDKEDFVDPSELCDPSIFIKKVECPRFSSGEGKAYFKDAKDSMRGHDLFIICDCFNYSESFSMFGLKFAPIGPSENFEVWKSLFAQSQTAEELRKKVDEIDEQRKEQKLPLFSSGVPMSPDNHFADLKRIISANRGEARRVSVIMPMLYEGRQHRRKLRESLDCAVALQELVDIGVDNIITFDAHDPRIANAVPLAGFENVTPIYQMLKALCNTYEDISLESRDLMIVSPDEGAMERCVEYSTILEVDLGTFYKRRDYTIMVDGRNPIKEHGYLGEDIGGKDVIVVDDMIATGDSLIDVLKELNNRGARRIFIFETFGLFIEGFERFDKAYKDGLFTKIFTTNLNYRSKELLDREWYVEVNMCKYVAYIIDALYHDMPIQSRLDPTKKIKALKEKQAKKAATQLSFTE